ncbi:MAG: hypothetical protein ACRC41_05915, partial [Sarcina sp.]
IVFLLFLCILLILGIILTYLFLDSRMREMKRQYRLLNNQFSSLKNRLAPSIEALKKIKVKYVSPSFSSGITKENIFVYFTPIDKERYVCKLKEAVDIPILEECVIANEIWLYIELETDDNINSRGWIQKRDFSFLKDKIQII